MSREQHLTQVPKLNGSEPAELERYTTDLGVWLEQFQQSVNYENLAVAGDLSVDGTSVLTSSQFGDASTVDIVELTALTDTTEKIPSSAAVTRVSQGFEPCIGRMVCKTSPSTKNLQGDIHLAHWDDVEVEIGAVTCITTAGASGNYIQVDNSGTYFLNGQALSTNTNATYLTISFWRNTTWNASTLHPDPTTQSREGQFYERTSSANSVIASLSQIAPDVSAGSIFTVGLQSGTSGVTHQASGVSNWFEVQRIA
jgi:hypothetical protein